MRQAKYKNPLTAYVSDTVYTTVKKITADKMVSIADWLRDLINRELKTH